MGPPSGLDDEEVLPLKLGERQNGAPAAKLGRAKALYADAQLTRTAVRCGLLILTWCGTRRAQGSPTEGLGVWPGSRLTPPPPPLLATAAARTGTF